jgi:hypothetical protein
LAAGEEMSIYVYLGVLLLGAFLLWITVEFLIPTLLLRLGQWDSKYSPLIQRPPSGEMFILVRGSRKGPYAAIVEEVMDYYYDEETHLFRPMTPEEIREDRDTKRDKGYLENLGLTWKDFWTYRYYRTIHYDKWDKLPDKEDHGLIQKTRGKLGAEGEAGNPSIFFRYNMGVKVKEAETKDNIPVNAIIMVTLQLTNPVQAYFFAGGWESQATGAIQSVFTRRYVPQKTFEQLKDEETPGDTTGKSGSKELIDMLKGLGGRNLTTGEIEDPEGLFVLYGIEVVNAWLVLIDAVKDAKIQEAMTAEGVAERKANAAIKEAAGIRARVDAWGSHPVGATVAMAEAIKETHLSALNIPPVIAVDTTPRSEPEKK